MTFGQVFLLLLVTCCAQLCRLTFVWRISTIHVPKFFYCWFFFPGITFCCYKNYRDIGEFVPKFWPNNCLHFVERGQIRCRITKDNYIRFWVSVGPWNTKKGSQQVQLDQSFVIKLIIVNLLQVQKPRSNFGICIRAERKLFLTMYFFFSVFPPLWWP